jgi:hypothetical protein
MKSRIVAFVAVLMLVVGTPISANAASHYKTPPSHDKFTTQANKEHIVSVVINCISGEVPSDCSNGHYDDYISLVYVWTAKNKTVVDVCGGGPGANHYINYENDTPHARFVDNGDGTVTEYPPKPGKLTPTDLRNIQTSAFCFGITTDVTLSNETEADQILEAEWNGLVRRVYNASPL